MTLLHTAQSGGSGHGELESVHTVVTIVVEVVLDGL
jgi:hypothetical protein